MVEGPTKFQEVDRVRELRAGTLGVSWPTWQRWVKGGCDTSDNLAWGSLRKVPKAKGDVIILNVQGNRQRTTHQTDPHVTPKHTHTEQEMTMGTAKPPRTEGADDSGSQEI